MDDSVLLKRFGDWLTAKYRYVPTEVLVPAGPASAYRQGGTLKMVPRRIAVEGFDGRRRAAMAARMALVAVAAAIPLEILHEAINLFPAGVGLQGRALLGGSSLAGLAAMVLVLLLTGDRMRELAGNPADYVKFSLAAAAGTLIATYFSWTSETMVSAFGEGVILGLGALAFGAVVRRARASAEDPFRYALYLVIGCAMGWWLAYGFMYGVVTGTLLATAFLTGCFFVVVPPRICRAGKR